MDNLRDEPMLPIWEATIGGNLKGEGQYENNTWKNFLFFIFDRWYMKENMEIDSKNDSLSFCLASWGLLVYFVYTLFTSSKLF